MPACGVTVEDTELYARIEHWESQGPWEEAFPNIKQQLPHGLPVELASSIELYVAAKITQREPVYTTSHSSHISTAVMAGGGVIHGTADTSRIEAPVTMKAYLMCAFAAFGGIFFGYDTGWMGGIMGMKLVAPLKWLP